MSDAKIGAELAEAKGSVNELTDGCASVHINTAGGWSEERLASGEAMEVVDTRGNIIAVVEID